jgi:hypothetical protein
MENDTKRCRGEETIWQRAGGRGQRVMRTGKGEVTKDG